MFHPILSLIFSHYHFLTMLPSVPDFVFDINLILTGFHTSKNSLVRSASLPRNYGRNGTGERASMMAAMMRTSVGNSGTMARPSNLALKKSSGWKSKVDIGVKNVEGIYGNS